jgi:RNA polymerase sigma-70 factor (ECF subfamily)
VSSHGPPRLPSAWPRDWVPEDAFRAYVAERAGEDGAKAERDVDALYLTCACVRGVPAAVRAFEKEYVGEIQRAGERMRLSADAAAELTQILRQELLVGRDGGRPKLAEYAGRGDLRGWLRVTATRAALKVIRRQGKFKDDDSALLEARSADDDPELSYMKALYRDAFRAAFRDAVAALDARDRNILRQHFVEGMTIDDLGAFYRVHRATTARWLAAAREHLLAETRKGFLRHARVSPRECDSVLRMVQSRLEASLWRLLS